MSPKLALCSIFATWTLLATISSGCSERSPPRKSLNYGLKPSHTWLTSSSELTFDHRGTSVHPDPLELATNFIQDQLSSMPDLLSQFRISPRSYLDEATGVTHVYARQYVYGLQVADGHANVNIKGGQVISFGSSFNHISPTNIATAAQIFGHSDHVYGVDSQVVLDQRLNYAEDLHAMLENDYVQYSVKSALLHLMSIATPSPEISSFISATNGQLIKGMAVSLAPSVDPFHNVTLLIENVPDAISSVPAYMVYATDDEGMLQLCWRYEVQMKDNWYEATVTVQTPYRILFIVDWTSGSSPSSQTGFFGDDLGQYNVFALGKVDPSSSSRTFETERKGSASQFGWHGLPYTHDPSVEGADRKRRAIHNTTTTWGNNAFVQSNWDGDDVFINKPRPAGGPEKMFDFTYSPKPGKQTNKTLEARKYANAAMSQIFYTTNMVHDLYYRYGFNEPAGNFQQYNFGLGGKENDAIIIFAQDASQPNNGLFMTPPDGRNPICRLGLFRRSDPYRDSAFDQSIVVHELTHGLTVRLAGDPSLSSCLGNTEGDGMSEGWSDFFALLLHAKPGFTDYTVGSWAFNNPAGIRNHPYSLNLTVNPSSYGDLNRLNESHELGEVWASMLWEVAQALVAVHGWRDDYFPPDLLPGHSLPDNDTYYRKGKGQLVPAQGNTLAMQLVMNALKLQPCQPTFIQARDAILLADKNLTGGENMCLIWNAFAKRGMGTEANYDTKRGRFTSGETVPAFCRK